MHCFRLKKNFYPHPNKGFTLTELLVVVSIISILTTAAIIGAVNVSRRSSYERAHKDIQGLIEAIELARTRSGERLGVNLAPGNDGITGSNCSECICRGLPDVATDASCWNNYTAAIDRINEAADQEVIHGYPRDPWGSPYLINENEMENSFNVGCSDLNGDGRACCSDSIKSAGPDHFTVANSDIGDDIVRNLQTLCRPIEGVHYADHL